MLDKLDLIQYYSTAPNIWCCVCVYVCVCVCKVNVVGEQPKTQPAHYDNQPPPPAEGGTPAPNSLFEI